MRHQNNFDLLRLIFASFVLISHSFVLSGNTDCDWLCYLLNTKLTLAAMAVKGFFVISGFLIMKSIERNQNFARFLLNRVLRIFPGLLTALTLTVIILVITYTLTNNEFFVEKSVFTYIPRNLFLIDLQYSIEGIFENNPYPKAINGSLWTIPYEVASYLIFSILILVRRIKFIHFITVAIFLAVLILKYQIIQIKPFYFLNLNFIQFLDLFGFFLAGSLLALIDNIYLNKKSVVIVSFAIFIFSLILNLDFLLLISFSVLVISIGIMYWRPFSKFNKNVGDISYGIYLYAFPIQQLLVYFFFPNYLFLMVLTIMISFPLAFLSWKYVEAPALKLKKLFPIKENPYLKK